MGDICLYVSTQKIDLVSALIRDRTECDWSHIGFFRLSDRMTYSAMCDGKGVSWRVLLPDQEIMLLDVDDEAALQRAFGLALAEEGKPYDELDIAGIALGANWCAPHHFICSTLVLDKFERAGYPLLGMWAIPLFHMSPRDCLLSPKIRKRLVTT